MKILQKLFFLSILICSLQGQQFQLKTVENSKLSTGLIYKKLIDLESPLSINLLEIDLTNPDLNIMAATAFDSVAGNEKVSSMVARKINQGHNIIAAINADFYELGGYSTNALVINGDFVHMPGKAFSTIGFNASNIPFINKIHFNANLYITGQTRKLNGVNKIRNSDELILYNSFMGSSSATNQWGVEVALHSIKNQSVNDTLFFIAERKQTGKGNMQIGNERFVLSGHDAGAEFINKFIFPGDTIKAFIGLKGMPGSLDDLVGGFTKLITKGKNNALESYNKVGNNSDYFVLSRHPRTAVGFNKSKSKLYIVTVDGRQIESIGMTLPDLADLMIQFGAYEALNLDGGGSTTMVVNNRVVNSPSDANGERAVSNALMICLSSSSDED